MSQMTCSDQGGQNDQHFYTPLAGDDGVSDAQMWKNNNSKIKIITFFI